MSTLKERVVSLVATTPGLTDREVTDRLLGPGSPQQGVNQVARALAATGQLTRQSRFDGKIGNYPAALHRPPGPLNEKASNVATTEIDTGSEDDVKRKLKSWLEAQGWDVAVVWQRVRGIDIDARRGDCRWVIEVKGQGSLNPMRVNYFLAVLGELLQRMNDPDARYSIALPDLPQFRRLWARLPNLAKDRTGISALFVADSGQVEEAT